MHCVACAPFPINPHPIIKKWGCFVSAKWSVASRTGNHSGYAVVGAWTRRRPPLSVAKHVSMTVKTKHTVSKPRTHVEKPPETSIDLSSYTRLRCVQAMRTWVERGYRLHGQYLASVGGVERCAINNNAYAFNTMHVKLVHFISGGPVVILFGTLACS